ncbi:hypothetical protein ScPMuIL_003383 [Solemya velum]
MSSYDDLIKQVASLKYENTHLRRELQDNSSHLTKLENEASNMKDVLSHFDLAMEGGDFSFTDEATFCRENQANESLISNSSNDDEDRLDSSVVRVGDTNNDDGKNAPYELGHKLDPVLERDRHIQAVMQELIQERLSLINDMEAEEKICVRFYEQLENMRKKLQSLPVSEAVSLKITDLARRQLEFDAKRLQETLQEKFGTREQMAQRQEARLYRIRAIEAELQHLQQQQAFVPKPGAENGAFTSDRVEFSSTQGMGYVAIATQTSDVLMVENAGIPPGSMSTNQNLSSIYHGAWPIAKDLDGQNGSSIGQHQELASVMSFNSTNTSSTNSGSAPPQPARRPQQQQLGTKVDMVYSLLSMLGTHDKDDMSRTLLAMSSSQDSCIAMRQSGCLPLLIQLLHGSDKDSGLLGNTRGGRTARERAAAALHNIVHSHPDDKRGRREARVLRLLEQIRAHCDQLRDSSSDEDEEGKKCSRPNMDHHPGPAIAQLMKLSFDEEHRHAICTLGGLQAIAELLQVDQNTLGNTSEQYNVAMRRYACMGLTNLTFGDGTNKALLCSMKDAMEALVEQLLSDSEDLCQVAASVLRNLSWRADLASKRTLRDVSAVKTLTLAAMRVKKESTLKSILSALWNLSAHCSENKADICAVDGALEFLVQMLTYKSPSKTLAIIENGGGILRNISSHIAVREDYRNVLRHHGCLQILLKHLRSPSLTIVSNACGTLWNLSARCAEDQQSLWEMGAVSMLRNLVHSKHKMISMGSAAALKNLLAARPAMKNSGLDRQTNVNKPSLHVRKQRALEAEIDQNLSETCDNMESPRSSPTENKTENETCRYPHTEDMRVYPVEQEHRRPLIRGQFYPRSASGDSSPVLDSMRSPQRVARSGSQDSVGSTHSDISHDRTRANSILTKNKLLNDRHGGSLDRKKETPLQRYNSDGSCAQDRSRHGQPNSRILQVMKEVAFHAGLNPDTYNESNNGMIPLHILQQQAIFRNCPIPKEFMNEKQGYKGIQMPSGRTQNLDQPINYSMKYQESNAQVRQTENQAAMGPPPPKIGNYVGSSFDPQRGLIVSPHQNFAIVNSGSTMFDGRFAGNNSIPPCGIMHHRFSAYAETDLDDIDQPTDYGSRFTEQCDDTYGDQPENYGAQYDDNDSNTCADCKLEEARRMNDRLEQVFSEDQVKTFCTEGTPLNYLSTATSLIDLSMKIPEKDNEKIREKVEVDTKSEKSVDDQNYASEPCDTEENSGSGSQATDPHTGSTVIPNYNASKEIEIETTENDLLEEVQERSFHAPADEDSCPDQPKVYCEEGTPVCLASFSRVSSLSSLNSTEARDRQETRPQLGLQSIDEHSISPGPTDESPAVPGRRKANSESECQVEIPEKEHKTVTFDDNHQVEETPLMFSRCSSLGSLSSFDAHSVHSSVVSEYSRRASEVVSPSELPDSPSETMPPSPKCKSPDVQNLGYEQESYLAGLKNFTSTTGEEVKLVKPMPKLPGITGKQLRLCKTPSEYGCDEAPVVYADEGTPPTFSDKLSVITIDDQETPKPKNVIPVDDDDDEHELKRMEDQDDSSMSEVSEGEEEVLAQCISSAMPNSSARKMKRSSSDNAIKKRSSIPTYGTSKSKIVKSLNMDAAKNLSPVTPKPVKSRSSEKEIIPVQTPQQPVQKPKLPQDMDTDTVKSYAVEGHPSTGANMMRKPQVSQKNVAVPSVQENEADSLKLFADEDVPVERYKGTPSKIVNQKPKVPRLETDMASEDTVKSFAVEDTNFSVEKITPVKLVSQKLQPNLQPDLNQDSLRSFAMEDTTFPESRATPKKTPANHKAMKPLPPLTVNNDTVKSYATEDTPFNGSPEVQMSAKGKKDPSPFETNNDSVISYAAEDIPQFALPVTQKEAKPTFSLPPAEADSDTVKLFATEDTPLTGSNLPSPRSKLMQKIGPSYSFADFMTNFDTMEDTVKSYATEGTPQNFSRTTSLSDISILTTNTGSICSKQFGENTPPPAPEDVHSDNSSLYDDNDELLSEIIQSAMPKEKPKKNVSSKTEASQQEKMEKAPEKVVETKQLTFQPQRTSSHVSGKQTFMNGDTLKAYTVEDTPINFSSATSLSDLTIDSIEASSSQFREVIVSSINQSSINQEATFGTSNDSVFLHSASYDSPRVYGVEGTPSTFSCNDSLSSLSIIDDDSVKDSAVLERLMKLCGGSEQNTSSGVVNTKSERLVIGQCADEAHFKSDRSEQMKSVCEQTKNFAVEDTPVCFSRSSSLSSLHSDNDEDKPAIKESLVKDNHSMYKVEDTPVCFSRNSSLSELSIDSTSYDPTPSEQALLDECISSALPKGKRDEKSRGNSKIPRTSPTGTNADKKSKAFRQSKKSTGKFKSESDTDSKNSEMKNSSKRKHKSNSGMTRSCSSADEIENICEKDRQSEYDSVYTNWRKMPHKSFEEMLPKTDHGVNFIRNASKLMEDECFLKQKKDVSNKEIALKSEASRTVTGNQPFLIQSESLEENTQMTEDNRMLEEKERAAAESELSSLPSRLSAGTDSSSSMEKVDSEKSVRSIEEGISSPEIDVVNNNDSIEMDQPDHVMDCRTPECLDELELESGCNTVDNTVIHVRNFENPDSTFSEYLNSEEIIPNASVTEERSDSPPPSQECSFEEEITPEDERLLEENASLIVSELEINKGLTSSTVDEDMFIEHETLSLVSNDYTSDTASERSISWSTNSEKNSDLSVATLSAGSRESKGPKIVTQTNQIKNQENGKMIRGRRKPLYARSSSSTSSKSASSKSDLVNKVTRQSSVPSRSTSATRGTAFTPIKKLPPKSAMTAPQACSTPNKISPKSKLVKPTVSVQSKTSPNNSSQKLSIPKVNSASKLPSASKSSPNRPKFPIKQGTFIKESPSSRMSKRSSTDEPSLDENANQTAESQKVNLREKRNSGGSSKSQRNSGGSASNRSSGGSPPEAWSKALGSFNFIVDSSTDNGYHAQYEAQKNTSKDATGGMRRNPATSNLGQVKKTANTSRLSSPSSRSQLTNKVNPTRAASNTNLRRAGSGASLTKSNSGASLNKSTSGASLSKTNSNGTIAKNNSNPNLRRLSAKGELKKSNSNASLKNNSRPSTPVNHRNSPSGIPMRRNEGTQGKNIPNSTDGKKSVGKKQVQSKIATLWKKDDDSNENAETPKAQQVSRLPVTGGSSTKQSKLAKPVQGNSKLKTPSKINTGKPTATVSHIGSPQEGLSRSSTYEKINSTYDSGDLPCYEGPDSAVVNTEETSRSRVNELEHTADRSSVEMAEGYSCKLDFGDQSEGDSGSASEPSRWSLGQCETQSFDELSSIQKSLSEMSSCIDSEISGLNLADEQKIDTGTWKKKKSAIDIKHLPNADKTQKQKSTIKKLFRISGKSGNNSSKQTGVWRRYKHDKTNDDVCESDDSNIWVKRGDGNNSGSAPQLSIQTDKETLKKGKGKKSADKSFLPIKAVARQIFGSHKNSSKHAGMAQKSKAKDGVSDAKMSQTLPKDFKRKSNQNGVQSETRTSPQAALVQPFNYTPSPKSQIVEPEDENDLSINVLQSSPGKKGVPQSPSKHATKTEMLIARRKSYLNSLKTDESSDDETKRPCMVTTV